MGAHAGLGCHKPGGMRPAASSVKMGPQCLLSPCSYLPGYNQLRFAASTTADVGWGDLRHCRDKDKSGEVAWPQEGPGRHWVP